MEKRNVGSKIVVSLLDFLTGVFGSAVLELSLSLSSVVVGTDYDGGGVEFLKLNKYNSGLFELIEFHIFHCRGMPTI